VICGSLLAIITDSRPERHDKAIDRSLQIKKIIKNRILSENILEKFKPIRTLLLDVDGVLTNGDLLITEKGELLRQMSTRDGQAIRIALDKGYQVGILTGGNSQGTIKRLQGLGITEIHSGLANKLDTFEILQHAYEWKRETVLYMGDDLPDIAVLQAVGLACCPADAAIEVKAVSQYISAFEGGKGCVRDVIEKVLRLNDDWSL